MNNKRIILGIFMLCVSTIMISCSSTKKTGCYYSDETIKEIPIEKKKANKAYSIAE